MFISCARQEEDSRTEISDLESELRAGSEIDTVKLKALLTAYRNYYESQPADSASPYYMMKEADLRQGALGENQRALELYQEITEDYPGHQLAPRAVFMSAYVYDENLKDTETARRLYGQLIREYPDDPLAREAKNLLALLNDTLSMEDQVRRWLSQDSLTQ